jgi:hypothetical protein
MSNRVVLDTFLPKDQRLHHVFVKNMSRRPVIDEKVMRIQPANET